MDDQVNFLKKSARLSKFINSKNNCSYDLVLKLLDRLFAAKFIRRQNSLTHMKKELNSGFK